MTHTRHPLCPLRPPLSPPRGSLRLSRPRAPLAPPRPPPDESDETKTLRKQSIVARISTLRPNDAIEAGLAADHIIAAEQSRDAVRWVHI